MWNDQDKPNDQEWSDPDGYEDQDWTDPENYEDQNWTDPENYEDQDWTDTENYEDQDWIDPEYYPGEDLEPVDEPDHTGTYRHEIDGIVFYTEHDVEQWIVRKDEPYYPQFNLDQMVKDIFGDDVTTGENSARIPVHGNTMLIILENSDMSGSRTRLQAQDGFYPAFQTEATAMYDLGDGSADYYKPFYFINGSYHCTDYEMIEIAVYACERWAAGEYYFFENFNGSSRLYIVDGSTPRN